MRPTAFAALTGCLALFGAPAAFAITGTAALTADFKTVCAGAAQGSALAARCAVVLSSTNPDAIALAANMNDLEEIPGAGRGDARDASPENNSGNQTTTQITPKLAVFTSIDDTRTIRTDDNIEAAFHADDVAYTLGLDWRPADKWQLGIALSHSNEIQDFFQSQGVLDANYTGAIATASWEATQHLVLDGYAGWLHGSEFVLRVPGFIDNSPPVAESATPDADRRLAGIALDGSFPQGRLEWRGSIGYDTLRTSIDGYTETGGSGFDLIVPGRSIETDRGRIDVGLASTFSESWGVWQPEARIGLRHEFGNDEHTVGVRFVDDTNGAVVDFNTGAPDRDWIQAGLSTAFTFPHGQSAFIALGREFDHSTSTATTYAIGWRIEL